MKKMFCCLGLITLMAPLFFSCSLQTSKHVTSKLHEFYQEVWEYELKTNPTAASFWGDRRYNDQLEKVSREEQLKKYKKYQEFWDFLHSFKESVNKLSHTEQLNFYILKKQLRDKLEYFRHQAYYLPVTGIDGFHLDFPQVVDYIPFETYKDFTDYIARLKAFKNWTQEHITVMREAMEKNIMPPKIVFKGLTSSMKIHRGGPVTKSVFYKPFLKNKTDKITPSQMNQLKKEAKKAIKNSIYPGYELFYNFMTKEYLPQARKTVGLWDLPGGKKYYQSLIDKFTTLPLTAQEIHEKGKSEVKRITKEMRKILRRVKFQGNLKEFRHYLRTDPRFYPKTKDELMMKVAYVLKKMDGELPKIFGKLPRTPYGIKEIPKFLAPKSTTAYYMLPSADGKRAGFYYVNTYKLNSRPLYEVEVLSLHEAVPGHHLQLALQQELKGLPEFRKFSRITAFIEGWGLYSEELGKYTGFYEDPYSDFGRLSYEMWRATRLVVDTGLHAFKWSRKRAQNYMAKHTSLSLHNIKTEVDRYISWPGQALSYKIGQLKILELRKLAQQKLGKKYDIREFHDVVLQDGSIPLTLLEKNVHRYITKKGSSL